MTSSVIVGVDIAKAKFDVARLDAEGKSKHKKFENTPEGFALFVAWLAGFGEAAALICMEATGAYSLPLAEFLVAQRFQVSMVNPAKIAAFARSELSRAKTDKADAKLIARYARAMRPAPWTPPPPEIRELQTLLRRVEQLQEMVRMESNRLATADPIITASIQSVIELLERELADTRDKIRRHIDRHPDLKQRRDLLESIPGVGTATAAWLLTALSDHYGFANAKQAVAHAGLAPIIRQSGQWAGKTHIAKTGDPLVRKALYMPALSALMFNPAIRAFCQRLKANGKPGKAVVCAAMRKLIHIAFAILKSGKPFNPNHALA
ncbi:MAG: IS110 family transposase [Alphaproteobacteria bacterium]|nr:MAG: IS110 family transposase [Alphaproteobacteria bacterium]